MIEYNKIDTLYKRDMEGSKKLLEGEFRNPTVEFLKDNIWTFTEKVDGCLHSKTRIVMADGSTKYIKDIKPGELVFGYDTDTLEYKVVPVIATQHKSRAGEWVKVKATRTGLNRGAGYGFIHCTHDHKVWTKNRGYVEAYQLTTDDILLSIRTGLQQLTPLQEQVLIGKMLGDGTFAIKTNDGMNTAHVAWGQKEEAYTDWCIKTLGDLALKSKPQVSGYGTTMHRAHTKNTVAIYNTFNHWYSSGVKEVPEDIKLTPISMAFWYMDDGALTHFDGQEDRVRFATNGFSYKSCQHLVRELNKFDIDATIKDYKKGNEICLTTDNAEKFFLLVAPYICESKKYKLPERYRAYPCYLPEDEEAQYKNMIVEQRVISIEKDPKPRERWDIQTETHNFFTLGGLVHNTNIRVQWDGHKVQFCGRTERAQIPSDLVNYLNSVFGTSEAEQIFEEKFGETEVILFGEGYGPKIQNGGLYRNDVSFILFDVLIAGNYQPRESVEDIAKAFGIAVVPIIFEGTIQEGVDFVKGHPDSTLGTAKMEGLVGRPKVEMRDRCGKRVIVKIKWEDFK
jgi:hypothetical protein